MSNMDMDVASLHLHYNCTHRDRDTDTDTDAGTLHFTFIFTLTLAISQWPTPTLRTLRTIALSPSLSTIGMFAPRAVRKLDATWRMACYKLLFNFTIFH
jgi:hypothetical protein